MSGGDGHSPGTIYVLAPVHNRIAVTERFVRCLAEQSDQRFHLVLVDDGSTDGTAEMATSIIPSTTVITGNGRWWWAGSLERARKWLAAQPERPDQLVLIVNDDTTFDADFLATGRVAMERGGRQLLLAQPYGLKSGVMTEMGTHVDWRYLRFRPASTPDEINCFSTRGLFLRRRDFAELGRFHAVLLPHYLSDYEFTLRAARRGFDLTTDPAVRLVFDESATGIRRPDDRSTGAYLRSVLSIRSAMNPIYWTTFLVLASPRRFLPGNLVRVWRRFASGLADARRRRASSPVGPVS